MKYCTRCGAELVDEAVVCTKCGCAAGSTGLVATGASGITQKFVIGLVMLILGIVGVVCSVGNVVSERSEFSNGNWFSGTLTTVSYVNSGYAALLIISIVAAIVGLIILGFKAKPKNKVLKKKGNRVVIAVLGIVIFIMLIYIGKNVINF